MADVYLTQAEMDLITQELDKRVQGDNYSNVYGVIARILSTHPEAANLANWFYGAQQANAGQGTFSLLIREYSQRQMLLRGVTSYTQPLMQDASDAVAVAAIKDIFKAERKMPDGTYLFPTIDQIADADATEVGRVLFKDLPETDSARAANAGWSGTTLFSALNSDQTSRLTRNAGERGLDRLEDLKNILFAYDAMEFAVSRNMETLIKQASTMSVDLRAYLTDFVIGSLTWAQSTTADVLMIMRANFSRKLDGPAKVLGTLIETVGTATVLDWIDATLKGAPVAAGGADIVGRAPSVFGAASLGEQQTWGIEMLPAEVAGIVNLAKSSDAARNALLALSPIVISKPSYAGDLSLYDPETGTGALSEEWLRDRAEFLQWNRLYREDGQTDGVFEMPLGLPAPVSGDLRFMDMGSGYQLKVNGLDGWVVPEKRIVFGGFGADGLSGADGDDRLYGGQGNDTLQGGAGDDHIEGNADSDSLDGGEGLDRLFGGEGADTLSGGAGSDVLEGGLGHDTYVYATGDGNDTITDTDGRIVVDGAGLTGGSRKKGESTYRSRDEKHEFQWWGSDLVIDGSIIVKNFKNGNLGIYLDEKNEEEPPEPPPYDPNRSRRPIDPLAFDMNGNGRIDTVASTESTAYFDFNGDAVAERTGWISGGDGLLAIDENGNGTIDDLSELFGTADVDGFADLKRRADSSGDNVVDASDTRFADLLIWRDHNGDGIAQAGELSTLDQVGIESISLAATPTDLMSADNRISATSQFMRNGQQGLVGDVKFAVDFADTDSNPDRALDKDVAFDDEVYALPWLRGFGLVKNLNQAYQEDLALRQSARELASKDMRSIFAGFEALLAQWTGLAAAHTRAGVTHASVSTEDKIWMLETLTGQNTNKSLIERAAFSSNPTTLGTRWDVPYIEEIYRKFVREASFSFALQAAGDTWLQGAYYSLSQDRFVVVDAAQFQAGFETAIASLDSRDAADFAAVVLMRSKIDGIGIDEARLRPVLAQSPYALTLVAALDANLSDFANIGWVIGRTHTEAVAGTQAAFLLGADSDDRLVGRNGGDILAGRAGKDRLDGGHGRDIYLFDAGDGADTISEAWYSENSDVDTIRFGAGITPALVSFKRSGQDLVLGVTGTDNQITISSWGATNAGRVERIEFADGTVWDAAMLDEFVRATAPVSTAGADTLQAWAGYNDTLHGLAGNDVLTGSSGNDVFDGGANDDQMHDTGGNDIYVFRRGDGQDTISDFAYNIGSSPSSDNVDTIRFGDGVTATDIVLSREGTALVFSITGTQDRIKVTEWGRDKQSRIEQVQFADGTLWDAAELEARVLALVAAGLRGGDGVDTLHGWNGHDELLQGGGGNDSLRGAGGNDTLEGGAGNDSLHGGGGNDVFDGGAGDDYSYDVGGKGTYVFRHGDGQDTIYTYDYSSGESASSDKVDAIRFGDGITAADIVLSSEGTDLVFSIAGTQDRIKVLSWGRGEKYRIEQVQFVDGTLWDAAELEARVLALSAGGQHGGEGADTLQGWEDQDDTLQGGGGNDSLLGASGNDTLEGGTGDDSLYGGVGSDTYRFGRGDGHDTIRDEDWDMNQDTLRFGAGITADDIAITREGKNLVFNIAGGDDRVTVYSWTEGYAYRIERVEFADGSAWDSEQLHARIAAMPYLGSDGNDLLDGDDMVNLLVGGKGDDSLQGRRGSDIYLFQRGDGADTIRESPSSAGDTDVLRFGDGIAPGEVTLSRKGGSEIVFTIAGSGGSVTVATWGSGESGQIERVEFADGTVWDQAYLAEQLAHLPLVGTDGNDWLYGESGDNLFDGGAGNDRQSGRGGDDVYLFSRGDGQDTIDEEDTSEGSVDTIRFGASISASDISLIRDTNNDILLSIAGGDDRITLRNWDPAVRNQVERIEFANGTVWELEELVRRVDAAVQIGTTGADTIWGNNGDNTLIGGRGNDTLSGGGGSDTYVFEQNDGQDFITESAGVDTIRFGVGIGAGDIVLSRDGKDITFALKGTQDRITVRSWLSSTSNRIERVAFADGTAWDAAALAAKVSALPIVGTSGIDLLSGDDADNTLDGGQGNDRLQGGYGGDTYLFRRGDGQDLIRDLGGVDTIRFGDGIAASDIALMREGNNLVLSLGQTSDRITIEDWTYYGKQIEQVAFADGTLWNSDFLAAQFSALPVVGTDGDDVLSGDENDNLFNGGAGNDSLKGGNGGDTYLFARGDGQDRIDDYGQDGVDTLRLGAGIKPANVLVSRNGNDLVFAIAGTDDRISVVDWSYGNTYRIEQVVFDDGTVWGAAGLAAKVSALPLVGTDGHDNLHGDEEANVFDGGAGNDTLSGGAGGDTYLFERGDGRDLISESYDDPDTIRFGAGISAADVLLAREGNDLVFAMKGSEDRVTVRYWGAGDSYRIERVEFADGTIWDTDTLASMLASVPIVGTDGDNYLYGDEGDNTFDGGAGNDYLSGGDGADTYLFDAGDGRDRISESEYGWFLEGGESDVDTIRFGAGIGAADVVLARDGADLVLKIAGTGDSIAIENWSRGSSYRVEQIVFADGTVWDAAALAAMASALPARGTEGDDELYGDEGDNLLAGGAGSDHMRGGDGGDTYVFARGDGQDRIDEEGYAGVDIIRFGAGIAASDIVVSRDGSGLAFAVAGAGDRVTVEGWASGDNYRVERVEFADGTVWDTAALKAMSAALPFEGSDGDDYLYGGAEGDTFVGGPGNDDIRGGSGRDTYVFGLGDGQDSIREVGDETDTIRFGAGIAAEDIVVTREGSDLVFAIAGTADRITVGNWKYGDEYRIERVEFADGSAWEADQLRAIVSGVPFVGTAGDDYLDGDKGGNTLEGGAGNDDLRGDEGGDTYLFRRGDGQDTIVDIDYDSSRIDALRFGAGIAETDVSVTRNGDDLVFSIAGGNDRIEVLNWNFSNTFRLERVEFADGTVWDADAIEAHITGARIEGTDGDDYLSGDDDGNIIIGGAGNDTMIGGYGNDTYLIAAGDGDDVIEDLDWSEGNVDTIRFGSGIAAGDVAVSRSGDDLVLSIGATGDTVTIQSARYGAHMLVERVEFADGTVWAADAMLARATAEALVGSEGDDWLQAWAGVDDRLHGMGGDDELYGGDGDDTLVGGAGNDYLSGDEGDDTYLFERGHGQDMIDNYSWEEGGVDTIRFGAGIAPSDILLARSETDLLISIAGTSDEVRVRNFGDGGGYQLARIAFADGTVWSAADVVQQLSGDVVGTADADDLYAWDGAGETLRGLGGDDYLAGNGGSDLLEGGAGDDYIDGGAGGDTYVFNRGDGHDTIGEYDWREEGSVDTLRFGAGITADDITLQRDGNDLVLTIPGGDVVTFQGWAYGPHDRVERFEFADGTVLSGKDLIVRAALGPVLGTEDDDYLYGWTGMDETLRGLGGADYLSGANGDDVLEGGTGDDRLSGWEGDDTYVFNRGDGQDTISESDEEDGVTRGFDTIRFGAGIAASDVGFSLSGYDLVMRIGTDGDSITIRDFAYDEGSKIEQIAFHDGTVWDSADIAARIPAESLLGMSGAAMLEGAAGYGVLGGSAANDAVDAGPARFEDASVGKPELGSWALSASLLEFSLSGGSDAAFGVDPGVGYGSAASQASSPLGGTQALLAASPLATARKGEYASELL